MHYKITKKYQIHRHQSCFFKLKMYQKSVFGRGSAPDPAGGAYDAPPDPLLGWGRGYLLPIPIPLLELGASILRPPQNKFLASVNAHH